MKTLEQLAREAGMVYEPHGDEWIDGDRLNADGVSLENLARFRAACRAEALEEAAQCCDRIERKKWETLRDGGKLEGFSSRDCSAAIREMK